MKYPLIVRDGAASTAKTSITPSGLKVIEKMAAKGQDQRTIAAVLGVHRKTLVNIRDRDPEVEEAWEKGHAALADELTHILLEHARDGNIIAAIYLTKARLGWREGEVMKDARVVTNTRVNIQMSPPMSKEEFQAIVDGTASGASEPQELLPGPSGAGGSGDSGEVTR
jgi:hypothetical protein